MAEEQNKSTLGLSDEDLKELGVELPKADETTKKIKKVKNESVTLLSDKQFDKIAIGSIALGIVVIILSYFLKPTFIIDVTEFSGFSIMLLTMVSYLLIQNLWLPLLFEAAVLIFKRKVGKFYRTWTIVTLLLDVVGVVGLVLSFCI